MEEGAGGDEIVGQDATVKVGVVRRVGSELERRETQRAQRLERDRVALCQPATSHTRRGGELSSGNSERASSTRESRAS